MKLKRIFLMIFAVAVMIAGCKEDVRVESVTLDKTTLELAVGGEATLTANVLPGDAENKAVSWKSSNTGVATVDAGGKVTAIAGGTATVTVTTADGGKTATCAVTVNAGVSGVTLNKTELTLTEGAAETLTATVEPAEATDKTVSWASSNTDVATVDATGKVTAVAEGTATITVTTTNGSKTATCAITVEADVDTPDPTYIISASGITSFGSVYTGYSLPSARTVTITNTGTGAVTLTQPTAINYTIGTLSATELEAGQTATFTVQPKGGLSLGTYNETIAISGSGNATASVSAQFSVTEYVPSYSYIITAEPEELESFGSLEFGYTQPEAQTVTVTNTGSGAVTLTNPTSTNYDIGDLSATNLAPGATATFTVQPKANLAVGTYNEKIAVDGSGGATDTVSVQFTVATYTISASPLTSFGSPEEGYSQPAAQTVTITNTGTGAVTLTQPVATNYTIGPLSATELEAGEKATFTVQPKGELQSGTYNETITVNGSNGATAPVSAQFTVTEPEHTIAMTTAKSGEVSFTVSGTGDAVIDWGDGSEPETVTLKSPFGNPGYTHTFAGATPRVISIDGENITYLLVRHQGVTALDVSNATELTSLDCVGNQLTSLDVSNNTALINFLCNTNQITSLDMSNNTELMDFRFSNNRLTSIDLSKNTKLLQILYCNNNLLTSLDVSQNKSLKGVRCQNNKLDAEALNTLFGTLSNLAGDQGIDITGNPGAAGCDQSIATAQGWTVTAE